MQASPQLKDLQYIPKVLRLENLEDEKIYGELIVDTKITVYDKIFSQLSELIKCKHPSKQIKPEEFEGYIKEHLGSINIRNYGVWVFYPWNNKLIHLLDKEEFILVRTNRNQCKITSDEQKTLSSKKIGIVGLSVGQSIALTLVLERVCGELRLADFDTAELSNLNRIRTPLTNLGLKKTVIAAREILEIDPYINIKLFNDGLDKSNFDAFFNDGGKIDLLIEVCDNIDIKVQSRYIARKLKVPVVMDTNDKGMLDVERFDIEPNRAIFHGLLGNDVIETQNLNPSEKLDLIFKIVNIENISSKLKTSMFEIGKTINTWPQLASSTVLGGAITTDVARKIFLSQHNQSGRYYIDFDELLSN